MNKYDTGDVDFEEYWKELKKHELLIHQHPTKELLYKVYKKEFVAGRQAEIDEECQTRMSRPLDPDD